MTGNISARNWCKTSVGTVHPTTCQEGTEEELNSRGWLRHAPAALSAERTGYSLYRRRSVPQGRSGQVRKISSLLEFDPPTAQPVATR